MSRLTLARAASIFAVAVAALLAGGACTNPPLDPADSWSVVDPTPVCPPSDIRVTCADQ